MKQPPCEVPLIVRGEIIEDYAKEFTTARGDRQFVTPDAAAYLNRLTIPPAAMSDLIGLRLDDVVDFLDALGRRLAIARNPHLQQAYELSRGASMLSDAILRDMYEKLPQMFRSDAVRHRVTALLGPGHLEGWIDLPAFDGAHTRARVRAFGARTVHIVAGNTPVIGAATVLNNAIIRGDALIKSPSNDPMTAAAVVRTMVEMAADHPLTRHASVAYWKGGDARIERPLYNPRRIEKIVAWGGVASIRHITGELQPGLDLITLDPKQGLAIIDAAALLEPASLEDVGRRLALDIGVLNQEACFNTRLVYLVGRGAPEELALATRLAETTFRCMQELPDAVSAPHPAFDMELKAELDALRMLDSDHIVIGGRRNEGAIIVSRSGTPVDFAHRLGCRVANIIPVKTVDAALAAVSSCAQTVCVYPQALQHSLRDRLALHGAQRIVPVGGASMDPDLACPQDGMELLRRMCKWIVDEEQAL